MDTREHLSLLVRSGHPCVAVQSSEEPRVMADIFSLAKKLGNRQVVTWSATDGIQVVNPNPKNIPDTNDLGGALMSLLAALRKGIANIESGKYIDTKRDQGAFVVQESIVVLRDPHTWPFERDPMLARVFRDVLTICPQAGTTVFVLAPEFKPHPTVERLVTIVDFGLPVVKDITRICEEMAKSFKESGSKDAALAATPEVIRALSGLTTSEVENALALSAIECGGYDATIIQREKVAAVKRSGLLEVVPAFEGGFEAIGGLENLKDWFRKRAKLFSAEAKLFGAPTPRATLLVGPPGSGKSASAKCAGMALGQPLLRLDVGALFNSLVGESEARCRAAIKQAEAMAPCTVWIN